MSAPVVGPASLVSVLLASRNGERYLEPALASLASQSHPAMEVIAVDDGSHDGTGAILERFARAHPHWRVLRTAGVGLAGALAQASALARGDLLARQDDDDLSRPQRLQRQVEYLAAHPEVAVVGTGTTVIDERGEAIGAYPLPLGAAAILRTLRKAPPFVHGSVMMRREAYERAGGYRAAFLAAQDYDLWLRLPAGAGLANLAEPLYVWRRHPGGVFARARDRQLFYAAVARAFAEERHATGRDSIALLERCREPEALLAQYPRADRLAFYLGEVHAREGRTAEARRFLARAMSHPRSLAQALAWWSLSFAVGLAPRARGRTAPAVPGAAGS